MEGSAGQLAPGDTEGVEGFCLEPHDLAIAKYAARREQDVAFTRELATRRITDRKQLLALLDVTPVDEAHRERIRLAFEANFRRAGR